MLLPPEAVKKVGYSCAECKINDVCIVGVFLKEQKAFDENSKVDHTFMAFALHKFREIIYALEKKEEENLRALAKMRDVIFAGPGDNFGGPNVIFIGPNDISVT
jgi:hypothetical protein